MLQVRRGRQTRAADPGLPEGPSQAFCRSLAYPGKLGSFFGGTTLDGAVLGVAAAAWFVGLFALALWTIQKKAAE